MTFLQKTSRLAILTIVAASLTACATKNERRGPQPDRDSAKQRPQQSGTFLLPISALFIDMDANSDKILSKAELQAGTEMEWKSFSGNPGAIDYNQWSLKNLGSTDAQPTFMSFDRDFNGSVTKAEFSAQLERQFDRLDKNKDGSLERSELIIAFQAPQERERGRSQQDGGQRGGRGGGGGGRPQR